MEAIVAKYLNAYERFLKAFHKQISNPQIDTMPTKKKAAKPAKKKTFRSAVTGRKVTKDYAKKNPDTTVSETKKKK